MVFSKKKNVFIFTVDIYLILSVIQMKKMKRLESKA